MAGGDERTQLSRALLGLVACAVATCTTAVVLAQAPAAPAPRTPLYMAGDSENRA